MTLVFKKLLKPIFRLAAAPGLGNPHTPHEEMLMLAGVKPVAIMGEEQISSQMQSAINNGQLIEVGHHKQEIPYSVYCLKSETERASVAAHIFESYWNGTPLPNVPYTDAFLALSYFQRPIELLEKDAPVPKRFSTEIVTEKSFNLARAIAQDAQTSEMIGLLEGRITSLAPVITRCDRPTISKEFDNAVENGVLSEIQIAKKISIKVIAQPHKEQDGRELFARYFCPEDDTYPPLQGRAWNARIGELLGYTQNDIAWSNGTKYSSAIVIKIMNATRDLRLQARFETMMDGPKV